MKVQLNFVSHYNFHVKHSSYIIQFTKLWQHLELLPSEPLLRTARRLAEQYKGEGRCQETNAWLLCPEQPFLRKGIQNTSESVKKGDNFFIILMEDYEVKRNISAMIS